jgi:Zn-dependent protease with chaperone function
MQITGRYTDGHTANVHDVTCRIESAGTSLATLVILNAGDSSEITRWRAADVFPLHAPNNQLRIGIHGRPVGERLVVRGFEQVRAAQDMLPALAEKHRADRTRQFKLAGIATFALASVIGAYLVGVPLLASRVVHLIPAEWETRMGDMVSEQIESVFSENGGFEVCDPDPDSLANRAIARFADAAMEGTGSPFKTSITVIRSTVPNAFALPGGRSFYFSALLDQTESPDEFAGVMAHELGHVAYRHGMEQLISTAGTGLLIGFVLGDMTGISVAGGIGSALIDSRFSREAERQADQFAADVASRMAFQPVALADLLDRVAGDDAFTRAFALLSTHPLTAERRAALDALTVSDSTSLIAPFTDAEWQAIKSMCGKPAANNGENSGTSEPEGDNPAKNSDKNRSPS